LNTTRSFLATTAHRLTVPDCRINKIVKYQGLTPKVPGAAPRGQKNQTETGDRPSDQVAGRGPALKGRSNRLAVETLPARFASIGHRADHSHSSRIGAANAGYLAAPIGIVCMFIATFVHIMVFYRQSSTDRVMQPIRIAGIVPAAMAASVIATAPKLSAAEGALPDDRRFALGVEYMVPGLASTYAKAGVQWTKPMATGFGWGDVEPNPPVNGRHQYSWRNTDRLILEYQKAGFQHFHIYTRAMSPWAGTAPSSELSSRGTYPPKPEYIPYYADYIRNLVERYDKDGIKDAPGLLYPVLYYEIEAEWGTGFWRGTADEYLDLLRVARQAAKAANPNAQIILIGFFIAGLFEENPNAEIENVLRARHPPNIQANIRRLLAEADHLLSHPELFDVVEFHSLSDWSEITGMTRFLRSTMRAHGYEKPIWVGDVNYTASPMLFWGIPLPPYTADQKPAIVETVSILANPQHQRYAEVEKWFRAEQAACLVKKTVLAMSAGCAGINLGNLEDWDIFNFVPTIVGTAASQGLIDRKGFKPGAPLALADRIPGDPRPAYHALALLARKLSNFKEVKQLALGQGVHAYNFKLRDGEITVLWYNDGKRYLPGETPPSCKVTLSVPQQTYRLAATPTERGIPLPPIKKLTPVNGKLTLDLGVTPVFIEPTK